MRPFIVGTDSGAVGVRTWLLAEPGRSLHRKPVLAPVVVAVAVPCCHSLEAMFGGSTGLATSVLWVCPRYQASASVVSMAVEGNIVVAVGTLDASGSA